MFFNAAFNTIQGINNVDKKNKYSKWSRPFAVQNIHKKV